MIQYFYILYSTKSYYKIKVVISCAVQCILVAIYFILSSLCLSLVLFAAVSINLESIMLSEISQIEKDKYCMISLLCGIIES